MPLWRERTSGPANRNTRLLLGILASNYVSEPGNAVSGFSAPGISFDRQKHDLSAVAGVAGEGLKQTEGYARSRAEIFGINVGSAAENGNGSGKRPVDIPDEPAPDSFPPFPSEKNGEETPP